MRLLLFTFLLSALSFGQDRNGISYQALIINPNAEQLPGQDNDHSPLTNTDICLQFHIINSSGNYEYSESQSVTTDAYGMVNLVIGTGTPIGAITWDAVAWSAEAKSLKVDLDITGACTSFTELSNQQLTSVPFALYSPASNTPGPKGDPGDPGADGDSAYQVWLDEGNTGTKQDFLDALKGADGSPGDPGVDGDSAYQVWLDAGNTGTEQEFLDALKGADGDPGEGTEGKSAYDIWIELGNTGSEQDFIDSLVGPQGEPGSGSTLTGGIEEFGCSTINPIYTSTSNGYAPSIIEINSNSKHIRINYNGETKRGGGDLEISIKCYDNNDNELIVFYDARYILSKFKNSGYGEDLTLPKSVDVSTTSNLLMISEYTNTTGAGSITLPIDIYSKNDINRVTIQTSFDGSGGIEIREVSALEFSCDNVNISLYEEPNVYSEVFNNKTINFVELGNQVWMQNNVDFETYTDGTPIPEFTGTEEEWIALNTGAWRYYEDSPSNGGLGKFYNWYAIKGIHDNDPNTPNKQFVPAGYKLPLKSDIEILVKYLSNNGFSLDGKTNQNLLNNTLAKSVYTNETTHFSISAESGVTNLRPYINILQNNSSKLNLLPYRLLNNSGFTEGAVRLWLDSDVGGPVSFLQIGSTSYDIKVYTEGVNWNNNTSHYDGKNAYLGMFVRLLKE